MTYTRMILRGSLRLAAKRLDVKLDELKAALRGRHGKSFFRKCVHQWLGEHA